MKSVNTIAYKFYILFFLLILVPQISSSAKQLPDIPIYVSSNHQSLLKQMTLELSGSYTFIDKINKEVPCDDFGMNFKVKNLDLDKDIFSKCFGIPNKQGEISELYLNLSSKIETDNTYWISFTGKKFPTELDGYQYSIVLKNYGGLLSKRALSFEFDKILPNHITVNNDIELGKSANYTVTVKHKGREDKNIEIKESPLTNAPNSTTLILDTRLKNNDVVVVKTRDKVGEISGSQKISVSHPKSSKDAINYFSLSLERNDNRDQKSIFSFNYKYDNSQNKARFAKGKWTEPTPVVDISYDNSETNTKQNANVKLQWSKYHFTIHTKKDKNGIYKIGQTFHNLGAGLELEDNFKNRNIVFSYLGTKKFLKFGKVKESVGDENKKPEITPSIHTSNPKLGIQLGRNFGLAGNIINANEVLDYEIARLVLDLNYSYKRDVNWFDIFNSFSFNVSNKMHYLFSDEVHIRTVIIDDKDKQKGFLEKGLKEFWEVELLFGLSDRLGLSLKHENGQVPQFFKDEDKISLSLVYSY